MDEQELKQSLINSISHHQGFGNYQVGDQISRGAYGHIFQLRNRTDNKLYVLKVLQSKNKYQLKSIKNEIKIQRNLSSRYVLRLINQFKDDQKDQASSNFYYMILDYCKKGDLQKYLKQNYPHGLPQQQLHSFCEQIARGISYIHKNNIVHGDIKLSNLLLTQNNEIKICDFGFAQMLSQGQKLKSNKGTLSYMAPETIQQYDSKADIWALGVLMFQLATGRLPFQIKSQKDFPQVLEKQNIQNLTYPGKLSIKFVHLLKHIFVYDYETRYTISQILNHPYFTGQDLIIQTKPKQRSNRVFKSYTSAVLINKQYDQLKPRKSKQILYDKIYELSTKDIQKNKNKNMEKRPIISSSTSKIVKNNVIFQSQKQIHHEKDKQNIQNSQNIRHNRVNVSQKNIKLNTYSTIQLKAKRKLSPLNTQNMVMKPIQKDKSIIKIDLNGITRITQQTQHGNLKKIKIVNIDSEGKFMRIKLNDNQKKFNFEDIPQKYLKQYEKCKAIVNLTKDFTPKIVFNKTAYPQNIQIQIMYSGKIIAQINDIQLVSSKQKMEKQQAKSQNELILKQYYLKIIGI